MPGYLIGQTTILDPKKYAEYRQVAGPILALYGGKVLVSSSHSKVLEGNPLSLTVVLEFESVEAAQRWYDSPEYTKAKQLRTGASEGWVLIAPQFEMPQHVSVPSNHQK